MMKRILPLASPTGALAVVLALGLTASLAGPAAAAGCTVEYKAKRDNPLKLEFASANLPASACASKQAAAAALSPRLAKRGWTLLAVVSILGDGSAAQKGRNGGGKSKRGN